VAIPATERERPPGPSRFWANQGVDEPEHLVARFDREFPAGYERESRSSPGFGEFFAAVKPFFSRIKEMKHDAARLGARLAHPPD
jgi:hypothetical protein